MIVFFLFYGVLGLLISFLAHFALRSRPHRDISSLDSPSRPRFVRFGPPFAVLVDRCIDASSLPFMLFFFFSCSFLRWPHRSSSSAPLPLCVSDCCVTSSMAGFYSDNHPWGASLLYLFSSLMHLDQTYFPFWATSMQGDMGLLLTSRTHDTHNAPGLHTLFVLVCGLGLVFFPRRLSLRFLKWFLHSSLPRAAFFAFSIYFAFLPTFLPSLLPLQGSPCSITIPPRQNGQRTRGREREKGWSNGWVMSVHTRNGAVFTPRLCAAGVRLDKSN